MTRPSGEWAQKAMEEGVFKMVQPTVSIRLTRWWRGDGPTLRPIGRGWRPGEACE